MPERSSEINPSLSIRCQAIDVERNVGRPDPQHAPFFFGFVSIESGNDTGIRNRLGHGFPAVEGRKGLERRYQIGRNLWRPVDGVLQAVCIVGPAHHLEGVVHRQALGSTAPEVAQAQVDDRVGREAVGWLR